MANPEIALHYIIAAALVVAAVGFVGGFLVAVNSYMNEIDVVDRQRIERRIVE